MSLGRQAPLLWCFLLANPWGRTTERGPAITSCLPLLRPQWTPMSFFPSCGATFLGLGSTCSGKIIGLLPQGWRRREDVMLKWAYDAEGSKGALQSPPYPPPSPRA
ncbi:hypothetical protein E2C01_041839 [Portunus trituberculatus]|uniref:Uncharacterized protein n=1 Tax=Portunus trituberculatus TaxID=210409 RepID=A0A5B7FUT6_PORTR|nr:hypothetical protein [Portunus trituberculatus]